MTSKYYTWNKRGSRMIIDSGYKKFDNQVVCISHGNVIGDCQYSTYVRPYNQIVCNGNIRDKGVLRDFDLQYMDCPYCVKDYIYSITENDTCIIYQFFTYGQGYYGKKDVFGFIVEQNGDFKIFNTSNTHWDKKQNCLEFIVKILEEK